MTTDHNIRRRPAKDGAAYHPPRHARRRQQAAAKPQLQGAAAVLAVLVDVVGTPDADLTRIEHLTAFYERLAFRESVRAFSEAMAAMQPELPVIDENGVILGTDGEPVATYATWEDTVEAIRPTLSKHGFALSFRPGRSSAGLPTVTGVLRHLGGHCEEGFLELPPDTTGGKNALQAIGSSTSYGQRYVARMLLSLTSRGDDDDARSAILTPEAAGAVADIQAFQRPAALIAWKRRNRTRLAALSPSDFRHVVGRYANRLRQLTDACSVGEAA